jgi:hypothetical protein
VFQRKRWPKLIAVAVFIAAAGWAGREAAYVALSEETTVALPGHPAGEDILNIRGGTIPGTCYWGGLFDYCKVTMPCATNDMACSTPGAHCTSNSGTNGQYAWRCGVQLIPYGKCKLFLDDCIKNQTTGCEGILGGCECQGTYPPWNAGSSQQCQNQ